MARYKVIYDGGDFIDGTDWHETLEEAIDVAKEILGSWVCEERYHWHRPTPTDEEVEKFNMMIDECGVWVEEEGHEEDEDWRYYLTDEEYNEVGWMYYDGKCV